MFVGARYKHVGIHYETVSSYIPERWPCDTGLHTRISDALERSHTKSQKFRQAADYGQEGSRAFGDETRAGEFRIDDIHNFLWQECSAAR